jgi:hypothetical protein
LLAQGVLTFRKFKRPKTFYLKLSLKRPTARVGRAFSWLAVPVAGMRNNSEKIMVEPEMLKAMIWCATFQATLSLLPLDSF